MVVQTLPMIATALKCFQRIQDFLTSESQRDHRLAIEPISSSMEFVPGADEALSDLLTVQDASIGWSTTGPALLHNLNFTIRSGQKVRYTRAQNNTVIEANNSTSGLCHRSSRDRQEYSAEGHGW